MVALPPVPRETAMPITPYLYGLKVDPETKRVMGLAFEMACAALGFPGDGLRPLVAGKIIELANTGERNPDKLCERALIDLRRSERLDQTLGSVVITPPAAPDAPPTQPA